MRFAFLINIYQDSMQTIEECLTYLRAAYPTSPVVLCCDGIEQHPFQSLADNFNCRLVSGPRLRVFPLGGAWLQRALIMLNQETADYFVKLDPDTRVIKPLSIFPDKDLFGYTRIRSDLRKYPIVQDSFITAAFVVIKKAAAQKLIASRELLKKKYKDQFYSYAFNNLQRGTDDNLSIGSWILSDAARAQKLTLGKSDEIFLQWRAAVDKSQWQKFAVVNTEGSRPS